MHTETYMPQPFLLDYPLEKLADPSQILFIDIETTGFTAKSSFLYLIGCAYFEGDTLHTIQWMAETYEQEKELLDTFFSFASRFFWISSGISPTANSFFREISNNNARLCLQGNCLLGQLQRNTGDASSEKSADTK